MKGKNAIIHSKQVINEGILNLALGNYETANEYFSEAIQELESEEPPGHNWTKYRPYIWRAAFGQGLSEGLAERGISDQKVSIAGTAAKAKRLYDTFLEFEELSSNPGNYKPLGKAYAELGLEDEGVKVLELSRHTDILNFVKLTYSVEEYLGT